jgi:hypothetical protein
MMKMKYSEIKMLFNDFNFIRFEVEDFIESYGIEEASKDFVVGGYRFIRHDYIDEIMCDELKSDEYMLGCFNAWFIADVLDIDCDVIEAMQKADAYEAIGKLIISMHKLIDLQRAYVSADSYGHHFNKYDGNQDELDIGSDTYYYFKEN